MEQLLSAHTIDGKSQGRKSRKIRDFLSKRHGPRRSAVSPAPSEIDELTSPEEICSTCRNVDWGSVLSSSSSLPVRKVLQVNLLNPSPCRFCNFLVQSLGTYPRLAEHDLLAVKIDPKLTPYPCTVEAFVLGLVPKWDFGFRTIWTFKSDVIFEECELVGSTLNPIQPLLDLDIVKPWLEHCLGSHPSRCQPSGSQANELHVIDCNTRQIIPHPSGTPYITLSYVWGQVAERHSATFSATQNVDETFLPPHVPQTVEDALQVTLQLGYQYLWVDKYCMDPNSGHFHAQLKQMNLVYQNSVLTIIAAAGTDSSYGLSGVSRRRTENRVQVGDHTITSIPQASPRLLRTSEWFTRGWTYQEGLLSTRRLIFMERQVYFECQSDWWYEGIAVTPEARSLVYSREGYKRGKSAGMFAADRTGSRDVDIKLRIEEYSERQLTNKNDILNAILGIFELFHQTFDVRHVWGIPYPNQDHSVARAGSPSSLQRLYFLISLVWTSRRRSSRRSAFPSWSWTGWLHAVEMESKGRVYQDGWGPLGYIVDDADWSLHLEKIDGTLVDWASCEKIHKASSASSTKAQSHDQLEQRELSKFLHIITYVTRLLPPTVNDASAFPTLESIAPSDEQYKVSLFMDLRDCSPETHELYVLHMPWKECNWMMVIRDLGDYWERVGIAFFGGNWGSTEHCTIKKTRMKIRLG
jgi:hypothetical protein